MKTRYLFLVPLSCMLLCACQNENTPSNSPSEESITSTESIDSTESSKSVEPPTSSESEPKPESSSSEPAKVALAAPELKVNASLYALSWADIANASGYSVQVDSGETSKVTNAICELDTTVGSHTIKVGALADASSNYKDSDIVTYEYEVKDTELGDLTYENNAITWSSYSGAELRYKYGDDKYSKVEGNKVSVTQSGSYTLQAASGYVKASGEAKDTFYINNEKKINTRTVIATASANEDLILEAGTDRTDSGLQEKYTVTKYVDGEGWKSSPAPISLDASNEGYTDGKCVKVGFWRHSAWFKYEKRVNITGTYDTLRFFAKAAADSKIILSFEITDTKYFGDIAIKGVYITYRFEPDALSEEWTEYFVSMADPNWQIDFGDGNKLAPDKFVAALKMKGININSLADVLPYFDVYQIRMFAMADTNYSSCSTYMDEIKLTNEGLRTGTRQIVKMKDNYAFEGKNASGRFARTSDDKGVVTVSNLNGSQVTINVKYEITSEGKLRIQSDQQGFDFDALYNSKHNGDEFEIDSASGNDAAFFEEMKLASYALVEDYESYAGTGQGFDSNHQDASQRSGLRAQYYCDYYPGAGYESYVSPIGGSGWSLMGSNDYLELNTEEANAHSGSKSARFKYNSQADCRYISYGLYDKTAPLLPSGSIFSFWTKCVETRVNKIRVKVYKVPQVTPSNQTGSTAYYEEQIFEIPQGSDWVECKVELKPGTAYYGFSLNPVKNNGTGQYFYVDDITVYNSISPWGNQ